MLSDREQDLAAKEQISARQQQSIAAPPGHVAEAGRGAHSQSFGTRLRRIVRRPQFWFGIAVLVPTIIYYFVFSFFPIARGLWLSVVDYDYIRRGDANFVGLENFRSILANPLLGVAVKNTVILGALEFFITLPLALLIASCLVNVRRGMQFYQAAIFLPVVVSLVAVSLLFKFLMDPDVGTFNKILRQLGLPTSRWLSSPSSALPTLAAIDIWKGLGGTVILLTGGLLNIPQELYDAARVDGVNEWQRFWHLTLPLLAHTLALVVVLGVIGSLQHYTAPAVLTQGGPGTSTLVYNMLIVQEGFNKFRFGTAAAAAVLQFAVIFILSMIQLKVLRPKWSY